MKILFWNTHRNHNINQYIMHLIQEYKIDVLITAEYRADKNELYNLFRENYLSLVECNTYGCERIDCWSSYTNVDVGRQDDYYSIQIIKNRFILCSVHLPTDLHGDYSEERLEKIQQIMYDIRKTEYEINSQKTIIIGDFNEMPYDRGCLNANGFHGLPVLSVKDKSTRKVNNIEYRKFYNPMWNLMGDFTYPPGTYFYNQSKLHSPMWYILDQIIMSKNVLPLFVKESLKIITSCGGINLANGKGHPNKKISDHFPIMCEIRDE